MDQDDLLRHVSEVLEQLGLAYHVTGSIASSVYGEPRYTNDIDIVLKLPLSRVTEFCSRFPESEYYVSEEAARQAVTEEGQFNIIHSSSGQKVDLILAWRSPLDRSRFERARRVQPRGDFQAMFSSPEDLILKKMQFFKLGESDKHLRDITGILKVQGEKIDRAYIEQWIDEMGVREIWEMVLARAEGRV